MKLSENKPITISLKNLFAVIGLTALAMTAWVVLKMEVASHGAQLQAISATVEADSAQIKVQGAILTQQGVLLERIDRKLDRIVLPLRSATAGSPE